MHPANREKETKSATAARPLLSPIEAGPGRLDRALARRRYESLLHEFREVLASDRFGAGSDVAALLRHDSLVPPAPATWRGRLGHWLIRVQSRVLWWTMRSFRLRDRAIESVWMSLEAHVRDQRTASDEMRRQLTALDERIRRMESGGRS